MIVVRFANRNIRKKQGQRVMKSIMNLSQTAKTIAKSLKYIQQNHKKTNGII